MLISIVIPCFNEDKVLDETVKRLQNLYEIIKNRYEIEYIFIDDGSSDNTKNIILEKIVENKKINLICFSRNFGHQIAVTAGIDYANGDAIVIMDADLQDPPEVVVEMINKFEEGYDVAYGQRTERLGESPFKLKTASWFYKILNKFSDTKIPMDTGDFRLISRRVADAIKQMPEKARFIRGMVAWVGYKQIAVPYTRSERFAGNTKYPLCKMLHFAVDGFLSFSSKPLQFATSIGFFLSGLSFLGIIFVLINRIFTKMWVTGWASMIICILFLGGVQLISIGILGEYIGRMFNESKARPLYLVDKVYGDNLKIE